MSRDVGRGKWLAQLGSTYLGRFSDHEHACATVLKAEEFVAGDLRPHRQIVNDEFRKRVQGALALERTHPRNV